MGSFQEHVLATKKLFEGKIINLRVDTVILPNGREATREVVEHPGAVAIVPILEDGRILLVRQYRHAVGQMMLEIPAGKLDKGELPEECALRELEEEAGYKAGKLRKLVSIYTAPGFSDEIIHLYVADNLVPTSQRLDEDEFLHIEVHGKEEIRNLISKGHICDGKSIAALLMAGV